MLLMWVRLWQVAISIYFIASFHVISSSGFGHHTSHGIVSWVQVAIMVHFMGCYQAWILLLSHRKKTTHTTTDAGSYISWCPPVYESNYSGQILWHHLISVIDSTEHVSLCYFIWTHGLEWLFHLIGVSNTRQCFLVLFHMYGWRRCLIAPSQGCISHNACLVVPFHGYRCHSMARNMVPSYWRRQLLVI